MIPKPSFFLAPMAEVTTPAFRCLVRRYSRDTILYSEMLSAGALLSRARHNEPLVRKMETDDPLVYQIVGAKPAVMAGACEILTANNPWGIDINMGCAAPEIVKTGAGAALLANRVLAREIVRSCRKAVTCRLSVKMRSGYDDHDIEGMLSLGKMLRDEGVDYIVLHPRHARLGFRRSADWSLVKVLREALTIPVVGNGDIASPMSALKRMEETGCGGVMVGREAVKSPWFFRILEDTFAGRSYRFDVDLQHLFIEGLDLIGTLLPERLHRSRGHRFSFYFSKNVTFSHNLYTRIRRESVITAMKLAVEAYFSRNQNERLRTIEPPTSDGSSGGV